MSNEQRAGDDYAETYPGDFGLDLADISRAFVAGAQWKAAAPQPTAAQGNERTPCHDKLVEALAEIVRLRIKLGIDPYAPIGAQEEQKS